MNLFGLKEEISVVCMAQNLLISAVWVFNNLLFTAFYICNSLKMLAMFQCIAWRSPIGCSLYSNKKAPQNFERLFLCLTEINSSGSCCSWCVSTGVWLFPWKGIERQNYPNYHTNNCICILYFAILTIICIPYFANFIYFCRLYSTILYFCRRKHSLNPQNRHGYLIVQIPEPAERDRHWLFALLARHPPVGRPHDCHRRE